MKAECDIMSVTPIVVWVAIKILNVFSIGMCSCSMFVTDLTSYCILMYPEQSTVHRDDGMCSGHTRAVTGHI